MKNGSRTSNLHGIDRLWYNIIAYEECSNGKADTDGIPTRATDDSAGSESAPDYPDYGGDNNPLIG